MKRITLILSFFLMLAAKAICQFIPEETDISIFTGERITKFTITPSSGRYAILDQDNNKLLELNYHNTVTFEAGQRGISIIRNDSVLFTISQAIIKGSGFQNSFIITPVNENIKYRIYDGNLAIRLKGGSFFLVNTVPLESYVAGTVQSESGFNRHNVFYQVQAIIIRTYALRNINRHAGDGNHLCDKVHCQAYYGKTTNPDIVLAVEQTRGEVLTDESSALLNTVYHANCGGQTVNSEDLWQQALPYLRSEIDTFCISMPGAVWQANIPAGNFRRQLQSNLGFYLDAAGWEHIINLKQNQRIHHLDPDQKIHLSRIRQQFGLRSTYFSVHLKADTLYFSGRGYGHGVGLCQEGAMERARYGHSREDILRFYYKGAMIKPLEPLVIFD